MKQVRNINKFTPGKKKKKYVIGFVNEIHIFFDKWSTNWIQIIKNLKKWFKIKSIIKWSQSINNRYLFKAFIFKSILVCQKSTHPKYIIRKNYKNTEAENQTIIQIEKKFALIFL